MKNTMKKLGLLIAVMIMAILFTVSVSAGEYRSGPYTYNLVESHHIIDGKWFFYAEIDSVDASISGDVVIPSTLGGYPVASIRDSLFEGNNNITSVTLPDGLTSMGGLALFKNCKNLTNVYLPDSLIIIDAAAFFGCTNLKNITIPNGVTTIGIGAFKSTGLESIDIPNSVTNIEYEAFRECTELKNINLPDSLIEIDHYAFAGCENIEELKLTDNLMPTDYAFDDCSVTNLTIDIKECTYLIPSAENIIITEKVEIFEDPFSSYYQPDLKNIDVYENNRYFSSDEGVLFNKDKTEIICYPRGKTETKYSIPDTVETICKKSFVNDFLKSVNLPFNLKTIEADAFYLPKLEKLSTIPNSVSEIGGWAFYEHSLTDVYFDGTEEEWNKISYYEEMDLGEYGKIIFTSFRPAVTMHFKNEIPPIIDPPTPEPEDPDEPDVPDIPTDHEHFYDDDEDETCNICGYDRTENCDCRCHNDNFFAKLIWSITNFFNKIFKKNSVCACGVAHY